MAEGPAIGPARRGRKDPDIAERLMLDEDTELLSDAGEDQDQEVTLLDAGDLVMARISKQAEMPSGSEAWFALGTVTRMREEETAEDVFLRAASFVHDGVDILIDRAVDAEHQLMEERRQRPIRPQR